MTDGEKKLLSSGRVGTMSRVHEICGKRGLQKSFQILSNQENDW